MEEDQTRFTCNFCGKAFKFKSLFEIHYRKHTREKPFSCRICSRAFSTAGNLKTRSKPVPPKDEMAPKDNKSPKDESPIDAGQTDIFPTEESKTPGSGNSSTSVNFMVGADVNCDQVTSSLETDVNSKTNNTDTPCITIEKSKSNNIPESVESISKTLLLEPSINRELETTGKTNDKEIVQEKIILVKSSEQIPDSNIHIDKGKQSASYKVSNSEEIDSNTTLLKDKQKPFSDNSDDVTAMETGGDEVRNTCRSNSLESTRQSSQETFEKIGNAESPDNAEMELEEDIDNNDCGEDNDMCDGTENNDMCDNIVKKSVNPNSDACHSVDKSNEPSLNDKLKDNFSDSDIAASRNDGPDGTPSLGTMADETRCTSDTDLMGLYYSETEMNSESIKDKPDETNSDLLESPRNPNIIKLYIKKVCREIVDGIIENVCEQGKLSNSSNDDITNYVKETKEKEHCVTESLGKETVVEKGAEKMVCNSQPTEVTNISERILSTDNVENTVQETRAEKESELNDAKIKMAIKESHPASQTSDKDDKICQGSDLKEKDALILDSETFKEKELRQIVLPTNTGENEDTALIETGIHTQEKAGDSVNSDIDNSQEKVSSTSNLNKDRDTSPNSENSQSQEDTNNPIQMLDLWNRITGGTNTAKEELLGLLTQKLIEECSKSTGTSVPEVPRQPPEQSTIDRNEPSVATKSDITWKEDKHVQSKTDVTEQTDITTSSKADEAQQSQEKSPGSDITKIQKVKENSDDQSKEKSTVTVANKTQHAKENLANSESAIVTITEGKVGPSVPKQSEGANEKGAKSQANTDDIQIKANKTDNNSATSNIRNDRKFSKDSEQPIVIDLEEQSANTGKQIQNESLRRGEITPVKQVPPGTSLLNRTPPQSSLQSPSPRRRGRPRKIIPGASSTPGPVLSPASTPKKKNFIENLIATGIPIIIPDDDDSKAPPERSAEFKMKAKKPTAPIMSNRQSHMMSPARSRDFQRFEMRSPPTPVKPRPIAPKPLSSPQSLNTSHFQSLSTPPKRQSYEMQQNNQPQSNNSIISLTPTQSARHIAGQINQPQQRIGQSPQHQQLILQSPQHSVQQQFIGQNTQQQFVRQSPQPRFVAHSPQPQFAQSPQMQQLPVQSSQGQLRLIAPSLATQPSVKRNISGTFVVIDDDTPTVVASNQSRSSSKITEVPVNTSISMQVSNTPPAVSPRNPARETREPSLPIITNVHSIAEEKDTYKSTGQVVKTSNATEVVKSELGKKIKEKVAIKKEPVDTYESSNKSKTVTQNVEQDNGASKREHSANKTKLIDQDEDGPPLKRVKKEPSSEDSSISSNTNTPTPSKTSNESHSSYKEMNMEDEKTSSSKDKSSAVKGRKKSSKSISESPIINTPLESKETITSPSKQKPQLELDIDLDDAESFRSGLSLEQVLQRMPSVHDSAGTSQDNSSTEEPTPKIPDGNGMNIKQESVDSSSEVSTMPKGDLSQKQFGCGDCGKSFSTKHSLSQHFKIHTREQPFECDVCGKHYSMKTHLKKHIYTHFKGNK